MHRMAQSHEGGLQKAFALGRVGMDRCGDVLEPRAHLERQAEAGGQFRNPGAHTNVIDVAGGGREATNGAMPARPRTP